ncbi:MAG: 5'/3'-nucleotidase SurE [Bacteroidales bacterium]|nr:5'/3'-nucleotidase SurE [Bacteroidales bacterium]MBN2819602.1 5'/3'-nucleotidase SurE [Bacteroidales bacterium]
MKNFEKERLILITNDDGYQAKGIKALVESMQPLGKIVVVAPTEPQSGMSHAITVKHPLRISKIKNEEDLKIFAVNGTPVDCVKLAINQLLPRKPDLLVSGINHGSNSSTSILYSGTMGAALEGSINLIPSIGFSHISYDHEADFSAAVILSRSIVEKALKNGIPKNICLNVNFPNANHSEIKGIKICRQTMGYWREEFDKRTDPIGKEYFWLTGYYHNDEPEAQDTDEWALKNNFVSIVPVQSDLTSYKTIKLLNKWDF